MRTRYGILVLCLALALSLLAGAQVAAADDGVCTGTCTGNLNATPGPPLTPAASFTLHGGYVAAGTGMRNLGYGTISIAGIPAGSQVQRAFLYWTILDLAEAPTFAQGVFNGTPITGTPIGSDVDPCWEPDVSWSWSYRADVTGLVAGNGAYALTGFASGIANGQDPWLVGNIAPMCEGASLVVVYRNPGSLLQTIVVYDGNDEFQGGDVVTNTLSGFVAHSPVTTAKVTFLGADGQDAPGDNDYFNGTLVAGPNAWDGSDPQAVPNYSWGNLWDTDTYDVTALVSPGDTSATVTVDSDSDCVVWVATVFSVSGSQAPPPVPDLSLWGIVGLTAALGAIVAWRLRRRTASL